jgi:ribonuclease HI
MLAKSAKLKWGLGHQALKVIYIGAIEPIMTYGAQVWEKAKQYEEIPASSKNDEHKIAKSFRTLSYEASCVLAGVHPIWLVIEDKVRTYKATHNNIEYDAPLEVRHWPHPAEIPLIRQSTILQHNVINIFTDGSKIGGKVGAAAVIIKDDMVIHQSKFQLHNRCSNNQAEQVAILRELQQMPNLQITEDAGKIAVVNTDSKVTLDTLQNRHKHCALIEYIRNEIKRLEDLRWTVYFNWVKAQEMK